MKVFVIEGQYSDMEDHDDILDVTKTRRAANKRINQYKSMVAYRKKLNALYNDIKVIQEKAAKKAEKLNLTAVVTLRTLELYESFYINEMFTLD